MGARLRRRGRGGAACRRGVAQRARLMACVAAPLASAVAFWMSFCSVRVSSPNFLLSAKKASEATRNTAARPGCVADIMARLPSRLTLFCAMRFRFVVRLELRMVTSAVSRLVSWPELEASKKAMSCRMIDSNSALWMRAMRRTSVMAVHQMRPPMATAPSVEHTMKPTKAERKDSGAMRA